MFNRKGEELGGASMLSSIMPAVGTGSTKSNAGSPRAIIDSGLCINGDLNTEGEVQVDGQIEGQVTCAHLIVGDEGAIFGDINASEVVVRGKVKGTVRAKRVILQASGQVEGDIHHDTLTMEEGARFKGASNQENVEPVVAPAKLQLVGKKRDRVGAV
jgi:cytoskeletal protein CcmA (bactofilin family)